MPEHWVYISADKQQYLLDSGKTKVVLTDEGTGMPEQDDITQRGPYQHGESLLDYFLRPRVVQLVVLHRGCSRQQYWDMRQNLINAIRPNRGNNGIGILRRHFNNGKKLDLSCKIQQGPNFEPRSLDTYGEHEFTETLRFIAYNPLWFNPSMKYNTWTITSVNELLFPITFPIVFGSSYIYGIQNITYNGNWLEYPTILMYGPITSPRITNLSTGDKIELSYIIPTGRVVVVNLQYGSKIVREYLASDISTYKAAYEAAHPGINGWPATIEAIQEDVFTPTVNFIPVSADSDLSEFHLGCIPLVTGGVNSIEFLGTATAATASVLLAYYERYIALTDY